jgi:HJR/Mrr/RecB family endonuclease
LPGSTAWAVSNSRRSSFELLDLLGWDALERTARFDKGADIVGVREGVRTAVQVKRRSNAVRIDAVRQLADGGRHECDAGLLVTNSYLTPPALESAARWRIEVWDRQVLAEYAAGDESIVDLRVCARCG